LAAQYREERRGGSDHCRPSGWFHYCSIPPDAGYLRRGSGAADSSKLAQRLEQTVYAPACCFTDTASRSPNESSTESKLVGDGLPALDRDQGRSSILDAAAWRVRIPEVAQPDSVEPHPDNRYRPFVLVSVVPNPTWEKITGTGGKDKAAVMGILERGPKSIGSKIRMKVIDNAKKKTLQSEIREHVLAGPPFLPMP
jgi:hypothetical protein